jgi:hypothetical protein
MVARRSFIKLRTILACACSKRSRRSMVRQAHHERLDLPLVLSSSKDALRSSRRSVRSRRSNRSTASLRSKRFRLRQVPSVPKFHLFQSSRSSPATKNQERSRIGGVKRVPQFKTELRGVGLRYLDNLLDLNGLKQVGSKEDTRLESIFRRAECKMTRFGGESDLRRMRKVGRSRLQSGLSRGEKGLNRL